MKKTISPKTLAGALSATFLAGTLSGCAETDFEKARQDTWLKRTVTTSLARCDQQKDYPQEIPYEARLKQRLAKVDDKDLEGLLDSGVTICLDQRLNYLPKPPNEDKIWGIYYPQSKILSLRDDGKDLDSKFHVSSDALCAQDSLAALRSSHQDFMSASIVKNDTIFTGFFCSEDWVWSEPDEVAKQLKFNPQIYNPPAVK